MLMPKNSQIAITVPFLKNAQMNPQTISASAMYALTVPYVISDPTRFTDLGASHHVTSDPLNLAVKNEYKGSQQLLVGNGDGLQSANFGMNTFIADKVPNRELHINNILLVPNITKNLLSVS